VVRKLPLPFLSRSFDRETGSRVEDELLVEEGLCKRESKMRKEGVR